MKKELRDKVLAGLIMITTVMPLFCINRHHDCYYNEIDECARVFYNDSFGACVQETIDYCCITIAIGWFAIIYALGIFKKISVTFIMAIIISFAVAMAIIDKSKWYFVGSLVISTSFSIYCLIVDSKDKSNERKV